MKTYKKLSDKSMREIIGGEGEVLAISDFRRLHGGPPLSAVETAEAASDGRAFGPDRRRV